MTNAINWFEIPVKNFERAKKFYTTVLETEITDAPMPNVKYEMGGVGGGIIEAEGCNPSKDGVLIYLPGGGDLSVPLARVEAAGGTILTPNRYWGKRFYGPCHRYRRE